MIKLPLRVYADKADAGLLARVGVRGSSFRYKPDAEPKDAVSVTMPVRFESYDWDYGLHPVFEMNLPEGWLHDQLMARFRKALGSFDDFDLLGVVGRTQLGRIRFSAADRGLNEAMPMQSVDEILRARREGDLFDHLLNTFTEYSGVSGVQPKVLIRDPQGLSDSPAPSGSVRGATHIVKLWEANTFPELAANEYFCLSAARKAGLRVPEFQLSDDGGALVVERFDLREDGSYSGVEDFCCLNGVASEHKYRGGYESRLFKRAVQFMPESEALASETLFRMLVFNVAIRNGDAHLKNFAVTYDNPEEKMAIAPAFDLVTTTAYLPKDQMALTIEGRPSWPPAATLKALGAQRTGLAPARVDEILSRTADALADTSAEVRGYVGDHPGFADIAARMESAWRDGISESLGQSRAFVATKSIKEPDVNSEKPGIVHFRA